MGLEKNAIARVVSEFTQLRQDAALCEWWSGQRVQMIDASLQQSGARLQADHARQARAAEATLHQTIARAQQTFDGRVQRQVRDEIARADRFLGILSKPWGDPAWQRHQADAQRAGPPIFPGAIRLGSLNWGSGTSTGVAPAMLPLLGARSALIRGAGQSLDQAIAVLQSAVVRLIATFPPGHFRLTLIDSVGVGQHLKLFLRLPQSVRRDKVFSESREIDDELRRLLRHVETVTQTRLLDVQTIEQYNARIGEVSVPYQFLVIVNFPAGFTDASAATLMSLAQNGPRTGAYFLATVDSSLPLPRGFDLNALAAHCTVLAPAGNSGNSFRWNDPLFEDYPVTFDGPPPVDLAHRLLDAVASVSESVTTTGIPFAKVAVPPQQQWLDSSADGLFVPIGIDSTGKLHEFELGSELVHHGLIGGATRMGKTNLLHVLLVQLASRYSPAELQLYLIDFKEGVEFQDYVTQKLPHARVVTVAREPEFGLSVLAELQREIERRGELFRTSGSATIKEYRQATGQTLPRLLLVMDEYQILFGDEGPHSLSPAANAALADLVRRGAAFGVHVLLSSQSPASSFTSNRAAMNQLALRISLRCPEADARLILGESNDAAKWLERPGEAIYNAGNGLPERNVFLQVARLEPDERKRRLQEMNALARQPRWRGQLPTEPMVVFDAKQPARLTANTVFARAAQGEVTAGSAPLQIWLGEAIDIKPHTAAAIERRGRANLLIAGQDEETGHALLASAMLGLCAQRPPDRLDLRVLTLGRTGQRWSTIFLETSSCLSQYGVQLIGAPGAADAVEQIAALVSERRTSGGIDTDLFLIVAGLDRLDALRDQDKYGNPGPCATAMLQILEDGPAVGVHTLAWTGVYSMVERLLRRQGTQAFGLRVALTLPVSEANIFLSGPEASRLPTGRALFQDDAWGGAPEKFKPYALPTADELKRIRAALRARTATAAPSAP